MQRMELGDYIKILESSNRIWFFKKNHTEEKLFALSKIGEYGIPSSIYYLIPFLNDNNKEIQQTTCNVIIHLFKIIVTKKGYYGIFKNCNISKSDLNFYQCTFTPEQCVVLYAIATFNGNGHVREEAIKLQVNTYNGMAISFIIYRFADWVPEIRQVALQALESFKKKKILNSLVENLSIFERLPGVQRTDLSAVYSDVMRFVYVENKQYVSDNFKTFIYSARIAIAKYLISSAHIDFEELKLLVCDKHFIVRFLALSHFEKFSQTEIELLLKDKSPKIRYKTIFNLKSRADFQDVIYPFIFDSSATIRDFARFSLKNKIIDFAAIYNNNLISKANVLVSLNGLAETNGKRFVENVADCLTGNVLKIRKAAFLTLEKLDKNKAYNFALENLDSEHLGMRNCIVNFFSVAPNQDVLQKAREIYFNGKYEKKKSMLKLFSKIGKWTTIADIMIGTIDEDENIRNYSLGLIQRWRNKATSYFTKPMLNELERANQVFRLAYEIHEEKKYFLQNPLIGIDFYLR